MQIITRTIQAGREPFWRLLLSDLHLGSPSFDRQRWTEDMDAARKVGAEIFINGDLYDAIDVLDKRFAADCIVKELQGKRSLIDATVDYGVDLLTPYAGLIISIGAGNHDMKWAKRNSSDPIRQTIDRLNLLAADGGFSRRIMHGGISGVLRTRFKFGTKSNDPSVTHDTWYHHGVGGDAPVTKGSIDFSRVEARYIADAYTMGHKHWRSAAWGKRNYLSSHDIPMEREHLLIQTGSYFRNHVYNPDEPLAIPYAEEFNHPPKPMGGWFHRIQPFVRKIKTVKGLTTLRGFKQDVMSSP